MVNSNSIVIVDPITNILLIFFISLLKLFIRK